MKKKIILPAFTIFLSLTLASTTGSSYAQVNKNQLSQSAIDALKAKVESKPDSLRLHLEYIRGVGAENPKLEKQYEAWMKKYPKSAMVPYALGLSYADRESPKAKAYLLKTVEINPNFAEAWAELSTDAERWGNFEEGRKYIGNAAAADPKNPSYAFYYASSFKGTDEVKYRQMSLDVVKRFPAHERGAQALYWLGISSKNNADKMKYFELLRTSYSPLKYNWSSTGMTSYYDVLLSENTDKALELAKELARNPDKQAHWSNLVLQAQNVVDAKKMITAKMATEAKALLDQVKVPKSFDFNKELILLKAKADDVAGNGSAAYEGLIDAFAKTPSTKLKSAISSYGKKVGKDGEQVDTDIKQKLDAVAKVATPFTLKQYLNPGNKSLADYKGKVVLLTYWFPGCGPCRAEFPHFENVVRKFKEKDLAYVGINIDSDQNDYVVPFMKSSGYSFTPLEDVEGRAKGNLDNGPAAPVNFLIDKEGRVIFSKFRTSGDNEDELELMINLLLSIKAS